MKTLKKIKNAVIETGRYLAKKPLEVILITALSAVPVACKNGKDPIIIPNNPPAITTTAPIDAIENELYTYDVDADDPDLDTLTYSFTQAPVGMTIDADTGVIQWTPTDDDASLYHNVAIKVDDGKDFITQSFQIYAKNTSTIQIKVQDIFNDADLAGMKVDLGSHTDTTDSNGIAEFFEVVEGLYPVEVRDGTSNENDYFTYKAGQYECRKGNELENTVLKVIPTTLESGDNKQKVLDHIKNCIRTPSNEDFDIKKWETCPEFRIYLREFSTGNPIDPAKIAIVREIIENEIEKVDPLFTNPIITEIDTTRPIGPLKDNYFDEIWDNSIPWFGFNINKFDGNTILGAYAGCKTDQQRSTWMQELTECVIGSGESNLYPSVLNDFNDPLLIPENFTTVDLKLWKIHQNRPAGNKDLGGADNHDVNPTTYTINP